MSHVADFDYLVFDFVPKFVPSEISEDLNKSIIIAWKDLVETRIFEVRSEINTIDEKRLQEVGLSGEQLDFKIRAFNFVRSKFKVEPSRFWRKLLKIIDSILGSLASLIPLAHPITEFKDALDSVLP